VCRGIPENSFNAASLLMTHLSAIFRGLLSLDLSLTEMISRANRLFCESTAQAHLRHSSLWSRNGKRSGNLQRGPLYAPTIETGRDTAA
jgi:hypothetical protein